MIIFSKVNACDMLDINYGRYIDGAAFLARGATGRWCEVMWCGPEFIRERNLAPITRDEAVQKIAALDGENYVDF